MPAQHTMGQMDLELRGAVSPLTSALPPPAGRAGTFLRSPAGNQRAATCALPPHRNPGGAIPTRLLLPSFSPQSQQPTPIWDLAE